MRESGRRPNTTRRWIIRSTIVSAVGLLFFFTDGLVFDLTPWAQAVINAATSLPYLKAGQHETAVVLFTEEDLSDNVLADETAYPIPYRLHANVLKSIANGKPRAIFIDFAFIHDKRDEQYQIAMKHCASTADKGKCEDEERKNYPRGAAFDALHARICEIHKTIKVFVVDTSQLDVPGQEGETFGGCAIPVGAFIDKEHIASGVLSYPKGGLAVYGDEELPHREFRVPADLSTPSAAGAAALLSGPTCGCASPFQREACAPLSAAYALWLSKYTCDDGERRLATIADRMSVIWPAREPMPDVRASLCSPPEPISKRLVHFFERGPEALKRKCPYSLTYTAGQLLHPIEDGDPKALTINLWQKTVLYGAKLAMSGDVVRSPVFAEMPAIFYHAIAYDNLVTFDGKPKVAPHGPKLLLVALLLVATAFLLSLRLHHEVVDQTPREWLWQYTRIAYLVLALVVVGTAVIVWEESTNTDAPEYLLLVCFAAYLLYRLVTAPVMGAIATACFMISLALYLGLGISFEKFLTMILFFEVVHLLLELLPKAAARVRTLYQERLPVDLPYGARFTLLLLEPFLYEKDSP